MKYGTNRVIIFFQIYFYRTGDCNHFGFSIYWYPVHVAIKYMHSSTVVLFTTTFHLSIYIPTSDWSQSTSEWSVYSLRWKFHLVATSSWSLRMTTLIFPSHIPTLIRYSVATLFHSLLDPSVLCQSLPLSTSLVHCATLYLFPLWYSVHYPLSHSPSLVLCCYPVPLTLGSLILWSLSQSSSSGIALSPLFLFP